MSFYVINKMDVTLDETRRALWGFWGPEGVTVVPVFLTREASDRFCGDTRHSFWGMWHGGMLVAVAICENAYDVRPYLVIHHDHYGSKAQMEAEMEEVLTCLLIRKKADPDHDYNNGPF